MALGIEQVDELVPASELCLAPHIMKPAYQLTIELVGHALFFLTSAPDTQNLRQVLFLFQLLELDRIKRPLETNHIPVGIEHRNEGFLLVPILAALRQDSPDLGLIGNPSGTIHVDAEPGQRIHARERVTDVLGNTLVVGRLARQRSKVIAHLGHTTLCRGTLVVANTGVAPSCQVHIILVAGHDQA